MSRTAVYSALTLRNRPLGESNSEIFMLTAEEGIIRATVFGGPKSKLRSHASPYNSGKVWIYRDPAKDYRKLSDFDVQSWRPGLRELYERTMTASAIAQTLLSTHGGGGDWEKALSLSTETLDTLENASEELCERLLVHFLWRWAHFLGIQPHLECCSVCGDEAADSPFWYSGSENSVLCENCLRGESPVPGFLKLNPGCRHWLTAVGRLDSSLLYRYSTDKKSLNEVKSLAVDVLAGALGTRLESWNW
jgi:DNA repair protein RecO (recombination protein O)